jgi:glycosyltransferase involved in cell wall biosynthesis
MIKVLEVIRQGQIGGGESHLLDLIYFLDKSKITPICLSFTDGEMIHRLTQMGITCYVIETQKPFDIGIQKQIIKLIKDEGVQLIHAHGSRAASNILCTARLLHIPFIYTVHGWSFHDDQPFWVKKLRGWSEKLICHYAKKVICVSQSNKDTGKEVIGLKEATVIENGINLNRFNPDSSYINLRKTFGFSESDCIVGFIARCTKQKNPIIYLEALEKAHADNSSLKGLFIGEGDLDAEVDAFIEEHHMKGYLYRSPFRTDVPDLLQCIDIYCLPSLWEGLSIALLEAMAMRKAIIATPTDGTCELIHNDENGIVVPFNDVLSLADAMNALAISKERCKRYGISARSLIEDRFNAERVAEMVTQIYNQI